MIRLVTENELIGRLVHRFPITFLISIYKIIFVPLQRFEIIGGLVGKNVVLPDSTQAKRIPCIADVEIHETKKGTMYRIPGKPNIADSFLLKILNMQIFFHDRLSMEGNVKSKISESISLLDRSQIQIISRKVKLGLQVLFVAFDLYISSNIFFLP